MQVQEDFNWRLEVWCHGRQIHTPRKKDILCCKQLVTKPQNVKENNRKFKSNLAQRGIVQDPPRNTEKVNLHFFPVGKCVRT